MAQLLGTREAARRAGLSRERLLRRVECGEISARHVDGHWFVDAVSLAAYIARQRRSERTGGVPQPA